MELQLAGEVLLSDVVRFQELLQEMDVEARGNGSLVLGQRLLEAITECLQNLYIYIYI